MASPDETYNLLDLVNGVREELGISDLPVGHYTQMRLIIGDKPDNGFNFMGEKHPYANYIIDSSDVYEVKSVNVANSGSYSVPLPAGTYRVVASTYGKATQVLATKVESDGDTVQNITF